jgi:hypothetical protein
MKPGRVSMAKAAAHIDRSLVSFSKLLNDGVIKREDRAVGYDLDEVRVAFIRHLTSVAAGRGAQGEGKLLSSARARQAIAIASERELKTGILSGKFLSRGAVVAALTDMFAIMREIMLGWPGKCADGLTPFCAEDRERISDFLQTEIYDVLTQLSADKVAVPTQMTADYDVKPRAGRRRAPEPGGVS